MKRHKVLEHTADVRLRVEADSLEDLFLAALEGMAGLIKEKFEGKTKIQKRIEIESPDQTSLLVDFLSEILTMSHSEKAVINDVQFIELSETKLSASVTGFRTDGFDDDIKAVTYHEAEIIRNNSGNYETIIVFDI